MENENKEYEILEEKAKFTQRLKRDDLIHFNDYLIDKRSKTSIFPKIMGAFIAILGIIGVVEDFTKETKDPFSIVVNILCVIIGVLFIFFMVPFTAKLQKKTIRKKITEDFEDMVMNVIVNDEGIGFEMLEGSGEHRDVIDSTADETITEETNQNEVQMSNEQARELEHEEANQETTHEIEDVDAVIEEENKVEEQEQNTSDYPNIFTIPWGGITRIDDDGEFMFINMVGYQALLIKKSEYEKIDEVVEYAKEKLQDPKRYVEIK